MVSWTFCVEVRKPNRRLIPADFSVCHSHQLGRIDRAIIILRLKGALKGHQDLKFHQKSVTEPVYSIDNQHKDQVSIVAVSIRHRAEKKP